MTQINIRSSNNVIYPILRDKYTHNFKCSVRKELSCADEGRCDIVIEGSDIIIIEFKTGKATIEAKDQLKRYMKHYRGFKNGKSVKGVIVAVSYDGNVNGYSIDFTNSKNDDLIFKNWHEFLRDITNS